MPYCVNKDGFGPTWGNSLFEDPAEFTYGMLLGTLQQRHKLADLAEQALANGTTRRCQSRPCRLAGKHARTRSCPAHMATSLRNCCRPTPTTPLLAEILSMANLFTKKSYWVFAGDGAAYDIAFGGIDHVLASGEDINVMVYDTEVYSNTGGQSSKATPTGSVAKFAYSGKKTAKKDMGAMAMTYGYVYVASVAMGANKQQMLKAMLEAESYDGPSLILCLRILHQPWHHGRYGQKPGRNGPGRQIRVLAPVPVQSGP